MRNSTPVKLLWSVIAALCCAVLAAEEVTPTPFPEPDALKSAVGFWRRIFTEVDSASGLIHDRDDLGAVYGTLYLNPDASPRLQNRLIARALERYRDALLRLASADKPASTSIELRAAWAWKSQASSEALEAAADNLRFQRGQSDRILRGLGRYAGWKSRIEGILQERGLPPQLAALPLVESSYNPEAVSKAGAAGLWQFMPATARSYLRVDQWVDERLDPIKSSTAAARFIRYNYSALEHWPLAITAYNHGLTGVRRAVQETGTQDLGEIAKSYQGERFGFASRNYYAAFLAAVQVVTDPSQYFGRFLEDAGDQTSLAVPVFMPVDAIVKGLGISLDRLRTLNPSVHYAVWNGSRFLPKGYLLQVPGSLDSAWAKERMVELAKELGFTAQIRTASYEVVSGDSLWRIAQMHDTTPENLVEMNQLASADDLYAGQRLRVPLASEPDPLRVAGPTALASRLKEDGGAGVLENESSADPVSLSTSDPSGRSPTPRGSSKADTN